MPNEPVTRAELAQLQLSGDSGELELVPLDAVVLRASARPISPEALGSVELGNVVAAMWRTLDALGNGVGLAAPQVGLPYQLFCLDDHDGHRFALANPARIGPPCLERLEDTEGCLSVPGFWGRVRRPAELTVRGFAPSGEELEVHGSGFVARILAHETDHLVGRLYLDLALPGTFAPEDPATLPGGFIFYVPRPRLRGQVRMR